MNELRWKGVYRARDYADSIQHDWQAGIPPGLPTQWTRLNRHYLVKKKQWSVVTGIPSHGKSTWMDNVMIGLARLHGWKFLVMSPENQPIERHVESLIEIHSGKKFSHPDNEERQGVALLGDELGISTAFIDEHFRFVNPDETDFHLDYLLELAHQIKMDEDDPFPFDGVLIDPYNEMEHKRPNSMNEVEYISWALGRIRRFTKIEDVHLWMVAHPTKLREIKSNEENPRGRKIYAKPALYDIAGAAHWFNKCDMGVVVYRNKDLSPETTTIDVQKIRYRECGTVGEVDMHYDYFCNRLVEDDNDLLCFRSR